MSALISALTPLSAATAFDEDLDENPVSSSARWPPLVRRIQNGEKEAVEELYRAFYSGIRMILCRHMGPQELEDRVHDTFVIVLTALRRGELRNPERLSAFVRTVVRRQIASHINGAVHDRRDCVNAESTPEQLVDDRQSPEETVISAQEVEIMRGVLNQVDVRDRELLIRFYLRGDSAETICSALNLSGTQFRLLKSRAKYRFSELGRRALARRVLPRFQGTPRSRPPI